MENLADFFRGKKILITGHSGFKGSWLSEILIGFGADVLGISLPPHTDPNLFSLLNLEKRTQTYFSDIRDFARTGAILREVQPEIVFHLAAQALVRESYKNPLATISTNILGTANILEAMRDLGSVKSAVIVTTDKVYDNKERDYSFREHDFLGGHDPYGSSKAAADIISQSYLKSFFQPEEYQKSHNTLIGIARAGNVLGGGDWSQDRIIPDIVRAVYEKRGALVIRNPDSIRPWQHVLEPLAGYLILARDLYNGRHDVSGAWNFGPRPENSFKVVDLAESVFKKIGEGSYKISPDQSKYEAKSLLLDSERASSILGWRPKLDFEATIGLTAEWYRNFYGKTASPAELTRKQVSDYFRNEV